MGFLQSSKRELGFFGKNNRRSKGGTVLKNIDILLIVEAIALSFLLGYFICYFVLVRPAQKIAKEALELLRKYEIKKP